MRSPSRFLQRFAASGLLALAVLWAQNLAALHWLSHAIEATQDKAGNGPANHACDECSALGSLGTGAVPAPVPTVPVPALRHALCAGPVRFEPPAPIRLAFRSRAPPRMT